MRQVIGCGVLFVTLFAPCAKSADEVRLGSVVLALGQTAAGVKEQLPEGVRLEFVRDTLPGRPVGTPSASGTTYETVIESGGRTVRIRYADEYGEHARLVVGKDPAAGAFLVFDDGKLTRITRLIGGENVHAAPASTVMQSLVDTLSTWSSQTPITVSTFEAAGVREISFVSGPRTLSVLERPGFLQVVENLGRGDIETVKTEGF